LSRFAGLARGVWDFIVGDDWRIALGVVAALGVTAIVSDTSVSAWWILPVAVAVLLLVSVSAVARPRR